MIVAVFADPEVQAVVSLSGNLHLSPFIPAFVLTPFASNASELVSSLQFASKMRKKNISLTFSQVWGACTMNNTMCLGLFLLVVYLRDLEWEFTAETVAILFSTYAVGLVGATRTTFPLAYVLPALALYPASLGLVLGLKSAGVD